MYLVYAQPGRVVDVMLQPGEVLSGTIHGGDTVRWQIEQTTSGTGDVARVHLLVKPKQAGLATNVVVPTNRRVYHLQLEATADAYLPAVAWTYPQTGDSAARARAGSGQQRSDTSERRAASLNAEASSYELRCGTAKRRPTLHGCWEPAFAAWLPVVSDSGAKTTFQFPGAMRHREAPVLFARDGDGELQVVNYRTRRTTFIADRLFETAELRLGKTYRIVVTRTERPRRWSRLYRARCGLVIPRRCPARGFDGGVPQAKDDGARTVIRLPAGIDTQQIDVTPYVGREAVFVCFERRGQRLILPGVYTRVRLGLVDGRVVTLSRRLGQRS